MKVTSKCISALVFGVSLIASTEVLVADSEIDAFTDQVRFTCLSGDIKKYGGSLAALNAAQNSLPNYAGGSVTPHSGGSIDFLSAERTWKVSIHLHKEGVRNYCYGEIRRPIREVADAIAAMHERRIDKPFGRVASVSNNIHYLDLPQRTVTISGKSTKINEQVMVIITEAEIERSNQPVTFLVGLYE